MNETSIERRAVLGEHLLHPGALIAIGVMALNDQVLKAAYPGILTGKLSDVAGLVFFPLLLQTGALAVGQMLTRRPQRRDRYIGSSVVLTGIVFALVNTWAPMTQAWAVAIGALQAAPGALAHCAAAQSLPALPELSPTRDPSDLLALPALGVAWRLGHTG